MAEIVGARPRRVAGTVPGCDGAQDALALGPAVSARPARPRGSQEPAAEAARLELPCDDQLQHFIASPIGDDGCSGRSWPAARIGWWAGPIPA